MKLYFLLFFSSLSFAGAGELFGLGPEVTARAGAILAETENAYAAFYNPALLATEPTPHFAFATSWVNTPSQNSVGGWNESRWALGFSYPAIIENWGRRQVGLGLALSGPYNKLRSFVAYLPTESYSVRYGNSDSQFKAAPGVSVEVLRDTLFFGAGLSLSILSAGATEAVLGDTPSTRMHVDAGLHSTWILGFYGHSGRTAMALVYQQKKAPQFEQNFDAHVAVTSDDNFHQPFNATGTLYFEPHSFDWETQYQLSDSEKISAGVSYQLWNEYQPPVLTTKTVDTDGTPLVTSAKIPEVKNTLNPRVSLESELSPGLNLLLGYSYRPSVTNSDFLVPGAIDGDTHVLGLGLTARTEPGSWVPFAAKWGIYGQFHRLTLGSENPTASTWGVGMSADL